MNANANKYREVTESDQLRRLADRMRRDGHPATGILFYEDQDLLLKEVKLPVAENTKQAPERQPRETDEPTQ